MEIAFRDLVLADVEECVVVGGPLERRGLADLLRDGGAGAEVFHAELVVAVAGAVDGVGEQVAVVADDLAADGHELLALGEFVDVEDDLLGGVEGAVFAAMDGILFSLLGAAVIPPLALLGGWVGIGFFETADHLLVELLAELLERGGDGVGVGVFGAEVGEDGGVLLLAEPKIVVDAGIAVDGDVLGFFIGERGLGRAEGELGVERGRGSEYESEGGGKRGEPGDGRTGRQR